MTTHNVGNDKKPADSMDLAHAGDIQRQLREAGHLPGFETTSGPDEEEVKWREWARRVLTDYRRPFDDHDKGLRTAISKLLGEMAGVP